jgi:2',3'-cyclic-nucleotide 2'-phosphodiesterase (5'-nucleotidase family)
MTKRIFSLLVSGDISMGQVLSVQPFGNVVDMVKLNGSILRQAFEHSVAKYDRHDRPGAFFQMSGWIHF